MFNIIIYYITYCNLNKYLVEVKIIPVSLDEHGCTVSSSELDCLSGSKGIPNPPG